MERRPAYQRGYLFRLLVGRHPRCRDCGKAVRPLLRVQCTPCAMVAWQQRKAELKDFGDAWFGPAPWHRDRNHMYYLRDFTELIGETP